MRLGTFVVALLLLAGTLAPTRGHLVLLVVFAGLAWLRLRPWRPLRPRAAADLRLVSFAIALLLLAGAVAPERGWLIALSVVSGLALVRAHRVAVELPGIGVRSPRWMEWAWEWGPDCDPGCDPGGDAWDARLTLRARRWERRWRRHDACARDGWR